MNIFLAIEANANAVVTANQTWYRNLYEPLLDLGHDVLLFDVKEGRAAFALKNSAMRADFSQKLLDAFKAAHAKRPFDLFFSYFIDGMVDPRVIKEIGEMGVPTCNFSCNNAHQFDLVTSLSPHFQFNLHAEKDAAAKFKAIEARPIWFPMASNPKYFKPSAVARNLDVSFVGANYASRARHVHYLLANGVDVHAFGPGWVGGARTPLRSLAKRYYFLAQSLLSRGIERQSRASAMLADHDFRIKLSRQYPRNMHAPVSDDRLISLYSESKISLGFLEVFLAHDPSSIPVKHVHLREFEAPMCGALYATGFTDELAEHFEPDQEIVVFRDVYELLDKVRFYLQHPALAGKIREAGHRRALADHTYHKRFQDLFHQLGLPAVASAR